MVLFSRWETVRNPNRWAKRKAWLTGKRMKTWRFQIWRTSVIFFWCLGWLSGALFGVRFLGSVLAQLLLLLARRRRTKSEVETMWKGSWGQLARFNRTGRTGPWKAWNSLSEGLIDTDGDLERKFIQDDLKSKLSMTSKWSRPTRIQKLRASFLNWAFLLVFFFGADII